MRRRDKEEAAPLLSPYRARRRSPEQDDVPKATPDASRSRYASSLHPPLGSLSVVFFLSHPIAGAAGMHTE
jgi:hypothetical protein